MNAKLNKFLSIFAGCFLAAYGTAVRAEVNIEQLPSTRRENQQSTVSTASDALSIDTPTTNSPTANALTIEDSYARLQALLNDEEPSDTDSSELSAAQQQPL